MLRFVAAVLAIGLSLAPQPARADGVNSLLAGVNGLLTAPIDLGYEAVYPPVSLEELPLAPASSHFLGFFSGVFTAISRVGYGVLDIALTPVWIVPTLSPRPVVEIIPFYEVEYEP